MKTITGETDQSGVVRHTVERDGEDVTVSVRREASLDRMAVNIKREHARELAKVLMEVADEAGLSTAATRFKHATGHHTRYLHQIDKLHKSGIFGVGFELDSTLFENIADQASQIACMIVNPTKCEEIAIGVAIMSSTAGKGSDKKLTKLLCHLAALGKHLKMQDVHAICEHWPSFRQCFHVSSLASSHVSLTARDIWNQLEVTGSMWLSSHGIDAEVAE